MNKLTILRKTICILLIAASFFMVLLVGGAIYLVNYALTPANVSRNNDEAWKGVYKTYPEVKAWHDSLVAVGALCDTTIAPYGYKMHAWYVKAARPTDKTALLLHGYTDCGISMMPIGRMYHRNLGMNILLPDLGDAGKTGKNHIEMGKEESIEARTWLATVPKLFGYSARVVVHGVSMGAATAMMTAADSTLSNIGVAYIEDCGYTSLDEQFTKELRERFHLPRYPLIPLASLISQNWYELKFSEVMPVKSIRNVKSPMLFIHGTADKYVPTKMVYALYKAKVKGPKQLWLAPEATHARSFKKYPKEYAARVFHFLQDNHFLDDKYWEEKQIERIMQRRNDETCIPPSPNRRHPFRR